MKENLRMPLQAVRRSASSSIPEPAQAVSRASTPASDPDDSAREFFERQAKTDAFVRTIPGLHNFGKR